MIETESPEYSWPEPGGPRLQWFWRLYFRLQYLVRRRRLARLDQEDREITERWEAAGG